MAAQLKDELSRKVNINGYTLPVAGVGRRVAYTFNKFYWSCNVTRMFFLCKLYSSALLNFPCTCKYLFMIMLKSSQVFEIR